MDNWFNGYLAFLLLSLLFFIVCHLESVIQQKKRPLKYIDLSEVTLLIPFRNEEENLHNLIFSLLTQQDLPKVIFLIDDHSSDNSLKIAHELLKEYSNFKILQLEEGKSGKKEALLKGIENISTPYVLTMDADVVIGENYMDNLKKIPQFDCVILPVLMRNENFLTQIFSTEYHFFSAFNFLVAPFSVLSASGANLLFHLEKVNYREQMEKHRHLLSGDDYFLLKEFKNKKSTIYVSKEVELSVKTDAPSNFSAYFNQRIRWLKKSKTSLRFGEIMLSLFIFLYWFGGFLVTFYALFSGKILLFLSFILLRLFADAFVYLNYYPAPQKIKELFYLLIFQLVYPLLLLSIAVGTFFFHPKWKGRKC